LFKGKRQGNPGIRDGPLLATYWQKENGKGSSHRSKGKSKGKREKGRFLFTKSQVNKRGPDLEKSKERQ